MLLMPIKSYAITPEEIANNTLEYTLKLQGINTPDHKKLWNEMRHLKEERENPNFKGEKNLIKFLIQKYDLDPINNAKDQCELMERITGYIVGSKYFGGPDICINDIGCANNYATISEADSKVLLKYGELTDGEGSHGYLYLITDSYSRPIGVWSSFNKPFSSKNGLYKILQGYREEGYNRLNFLIFNSGNDKNASYLKIDGCYIKEIHLKLDQVYIDPIYSKKSKTKN
jgi:hypothetical protein